jgi:uncharacterized protein
MYVSGLNKTAAENIVAYRNAKGEFKDREAILKVPKLGAKSYEQAIGFLRIPNSIEVLDATSIHPESYKIAKAIIKKLNLNESQLGKPEVKELVDKLDKAQLAKELNVDTFTLEDILSALIAPQRDPRDEFSAPILKSDILKLEDLTVGMQLEGVVRNVTDFGAFVDIGLKNDGLVHISKITKRYIKHPKEVLAVGDIVTVYILKIDQNKGQVGLTMIKE